MSRFPGQDCGLPDASDISPDYNRGKSPVHAVSSTKLNPVLITYSSSSNKGESSAQGNSFSLAAVTHRDAAPDPRPAAAAPGGAAAAGLVGRGQPGAEEGHQEAVLPGPAGGDPGADVRAALRGSDERFPPRAAAGAAGQTQPDLPEQREVPGRPQDAPPGQPAQHLPLGLQVRAGAGRICSYLWPVRDHLKLDIEHFLHSKHSTKPQPKDILSWKCSAVYTQIMWCYYYYYYCM